MEQLEAKVQLNARKKRGGVEYILFFSSFGMDLENTFQMMIHAAFF